MAETEIPEPDRVAGAPHPRETPRLFGQDAAEATFLRAVASGRLHHAWLIAGPRGVGKATLAWRIARFLLAAPEDAGLFGPPESLDVDPGHPVARRMRALSEPRLFLLRRPWDERAKRLKQEITVDAARRMKGFFALSAADGGRRAVIVDAADEMNPSTANAILKLLEEPPENTVILLVAHQPARLLPTIRSRCRVLRCRPLGPEDLAAALTQAGAEVDPDALAGPLAALAGGSAGAALGLVEHEGVAAYAALVRLFRDAPGIDRPAAIELAQSAGRDAAFDQLLYLVDLFLARLARAGVAGPPEPEGAPGEAALLARLSPDHRAARRWADLHDRLGARARHGRAVNLDPAALLLDMVLKIDAGAAPAPA